jgi:GntR family transcriptional regulator
MSNSSERKQAESDFIVQRLAPDKVLSEPVYKQMLRRMRELVEAGEIGTGQSMPAERTLAEKLNISRTTVRRFYNELRLRNELISDGRNGAVLIAPPKLHPTLGKLKGFTEEMRECGIEPSTRLIERSVTQDRTIASMIDRPSTTDLLKLVRIRLGDGIPMSRETAWYDLSIAPDMTRWSIEGSAYDFIQHRCGVRLMDAEQTVEAVMASEVECEVFGFDKPAPCLLFKRKTRSVSGQIVEYVEGVFRGDAYVYRLTLR